MRPARWRIAADASALAREAAECVVAAIENGGDRPAVCLTGGSTPRLLYSLLGEEAFARRIAWRNVHWFVGDERFVPPEHELSNLGQARRLFLDRHAPPENIHAVPTGAADVHAAAQAYEAELEAFHAGQEKSDPLFALVLLGLGPDGHVASLFPGAPAAAETRRWVEGVEEAGLEPYVPRVTLTIPALSSCRELLFIAAEPEKAPILTRIAGGADLPATAVTSWLRTTWLVDQAASPPPDALGARLILVMGVSGAGKTTIGSELARRLDWAFLDADDLHSQANREKMQAGAPLTDADREPWLEAVRNEIAGARARNVDLVVACSAVRKRYRDELMAANARHRIVCLRGEPSLIETRMRSREGHFLSPSLLPDQLAIFEPPGPEEQALELDVIAPVRALVDRILRTFRGFILVGRI